VRVVRVGVVVVKVVGVVREVQAVREV